MSTTRGRESERHHTEGSCLNLPASAPHRYKLFFKLLMHDRAEVNSKEVTRTHKLPTNQGAALVLRSAPPESLAPELIQAAAGV
ncbi:hypothetical protein DPX16_15998 [Anabarilius grahami]|uniref:Uncharacterized protein n=1 Tax=Anabarilius grahami TaxID=495550 RepID=A0A3N0YU09_ANAGA|nr:hypothetical protein DPX16_15998 [Anabarilius grahami]